MPEPGSVPLTINSQGECLITGDKLFGEPASFCNLEKLSHQYLLRDAIHFFRKSCLSSTCDAICFQVHWPRRLQAGQRVTRINTTSPGLRPFFGPAPLTNRT